MTVVMTSSVIRKILFNPFRKYCVAQINGGSYYQMVPPSEVRKRIRQTLNQCHPHSKLQHHIDVKEVTMDLTPATSNTIFKISSLLEL
jgi:hypothetical protein